MTKEQLLELIHNEVLEYFSNSEDAQKLSLSLTEKILPLLSPNKEKNRGLKFLKDLAPGILQILTKNKK